MEMKLSSKSRHYSPCDSPIRQRGEEIPSQRWHYRAEGVIALRMLLLTPPHADHLQAPLPLCAMEDVTRQHLVTEPLLAPTRVMLRLDRTHKNGRKIRLDRDWYMGAEEGGVVGDEEFNPLAQHDDLAAIKKEQMAKKQIRSRRYLRTFKRVVNCLAIECRQRPLGGG
ncbi:hypothetical protein C8Q74DRAFT_278517 [Fomes fomentarius]|nr:hypothetical protein C8Q74DRAFT_278517 [Fomes fomentarius]